MTSTEQFEGRPARAPALEQSAADDGHLIGRDPRRMSISELTTLGHSAQPLLSVIRAKCLDCAGHEPSEVRKCTAVDCPLWPYRMAHNPFREISPAQREQGRRLAARRLAGAPPSDRPANRETPETPDAEMTYARPDDYGPTGGPSVRRCEACRAEFRPTRPWSRFCSAACEQRARRARRRAGQNEPPAPSGDPIKS